MGVLKTEICNILPIPEMNAFLLHSLLNPLFMWPLHCEQIFTVQRFLFRANRQRQKRMNRSAKETR